MDFKSFEKLAQDQPLLDGFSAGHTDKLAAMARMAHFAAAEIISGPGVCSRPIVRQRRSASGFESRSEQLAIRCPSEKPGCRH